MQTIVAAGFEEYTAQELVPIRDPLTGLRAAAGFCGV